MLDDTDYGHVFVYYCCTYYEAARHVLPVAHVLHYPPPPPAHSFLLGPAVTNNIILLEKVRVGGATLSAAAAK